MIKITLKTWITFISILLGISSCVNVIKIPFSATFHFFKRAFMGTFYKVCIHYLEDDIDSLQDRERFHRSILAPNSECLTRLPSFSFLMKHKMYSVPLSILHISLFFFIFFHRFRVFVFVMIATILIILNSVISKHWLWVLGLTIRNA